MNCGFEFWRDKYRLLGSFDDKYMFKFPIPFDAMLDSRDAVADRTSKQALAYFRKEVVCDEGGAGSCFATLQNNGILAKGVDVPAMMSVMLDARAAALAAIADALTA